MIRTLLAVIGGLALLAIVLFVGLAVMAVRMGSDAMAGASAYADETIAEFAENWDTRTLLRRGSPEFLEIVSRDRTALDQMEAILNRQAGPLASVDPSACPNVNAFATGEGTVVQATCVAEGETARGAIAFRVNVIRRRDEWRLLGLFFNLVPGENAGAIMVNAAPRRGASFARVSASLMEPSLGFTTAVPADGRVGVGIEFSTHDASARHAGGAR